ncbi:MAG: hypothetical protein IPK44_18800 [Candidatus Accumulibacter sp.]|uniref:hypothetical protein n=1 Tax=Accumulibacter sp. TaxID=2053492 RepID=UPI00258AE622|nr:hypothetical protein [Accumulibacter sp.]MBK8116391.1 hypothetical protein [Accumulibacter sp.]
MIARSGREVSLPYLSALSESWVASGDNVGSALWNQGHQLARLLIDQHDDWRVPAWLPPSGEGKAAAMLDSLNRLQDRENLAAFLAEISAGGYYDSGDNEALSEALTLLPPEHAAALLEAIVAANAPRQATACAELVQRVASHFAANGSGSLLQPALAALVNVLPGKPVLAPRPDGWRVQPPTPALVVDLLTALRHTDTPAIGESVRTTCWRTRTPSQPMRYWFQPPCGLLNRARLPATGHRRAVSSPPVWRIWSNASLNHSQHCRTSPGQATSPAHAVTAATSPVSSPTGSATCGSSRPPRCIADTSSSRFGATPATSIRKPIAAAALCPGLHQEPGELRATRRAAPQGS